MKTDPERKLDLRGKECPYTILDLARAVRELGPGSVLEIVVEQESTVDDIRAWCEGTGNEFLASEGGAAAKVYLRKA
jgi:TusA-related sulfurtransferase